MPSPIFVTGATGTSGQALMGHLASSGLPARIFVRDQAKIAGTAGPGMEVVQGDLADRASLLRALEGVETAYFNSAVSEHALELFENLLTAAREAGVRHIIKFSGWGAKAGSPVGFMDLNGRGDDLLKESGLAYTILKPNSFFQNVFWSLATITSQSTMYAGTGTAKQSIVDVRDIGEATVQILRDPSRHAGKEYILTGSEGLSAEDQAAVLSRVIGRTVSCVLVPPAAVEQSLLSIGSPAWNARSVAAFVDDVSQGHYAGVNSDLPDLIGRAPNTFEAFLREHAAAFHKAA